MRGGSLQEELQDSRVLVVDDEPSNVSVLERLLRRWGYEEVASTTDSREAMDLFRDFGPDLILLDLHMPHLDGFAILDRLRAEVPDGVYLPVLVLTGDANPEVMERALTMGARDFVTKPFEATEVLLRIENLLQTRRLHRKLRRHNQTLESKVRERTRELADAQVEIVHRLALAAEYRDDVTGRHAERVGVLSTLLASALGLPRDELRLIRRAAPLHDVGKIGIPDAILMKPGPLSDEEFEVMKSHARIGAKILSGSRYPLLETAQVIALTHHERWDGSGYIRGLAGEEIPPVGRIVALADAFDTLTHARPYKQPSTMAEAVAEIREERGAHFDPRVVDAFEGLEEEGRLEELDDLVELSARRLDAVAPSPAP